jgi:hypothetical protein
MGNMAARKRSKEQIIRDRIRIEELALQQYSNQEIRDILHKETGIHLAVQQINYDRNKIRKQWRERQHKHYDELMSIELSRIDVLERSIWNALRMQVEPKKREEIERAARKVADAEGEEEYKLIITKTKNVVEDTAANASYFAQISDCQKERRKLLGLYAPQLIDVQKKVVVKGYAEVSPEDWPSSPSTIEGVVVKE